MRPTTSDIAREAGVSLATVDRVLNERPGVRQRTIEKVRSAIDTLGYVRDVSAANLARQRTYRLAFLVPDADNEFATVIRDTIRHAARTADTDRTQLSLISVPAHDPHALVRVLANIDKDRLDGIGLMAPETPLIRDAIRDLKRSGIAVVALVSDLPNTERDFFVGINNVAAGRTAAELLGRFSGGKPGRVLILTNSMQSQDSAQRRFGFDSAIARYFTSIEVMPTMESHDDAERINHMVHNAFTTYDNIFGVYSLGTGNRALAQSLRELDLVHPPCVIAHELTPHTRSALQSGEIDAVITQNAGHIIRSALRLLRACSDDIAVVAEQDRIRIEIITRGNIP